MTLGDTHFPLIAQKLPLLKLVSPDNVLYDGVPPTVLSCLCTICGAPDWFVTKTENRVPSDAFKNVKLYTGPVKFRTNSFTGELCKSTST
jgi:hypothetical protein